MFPSASVPNCAVSRKANKNIDEGADAMQHLPLFSYKSLLKGDAEKTNRALSLSGVFDECSVGYRQVAGVTLA